MTSTEITALAERLEGTAHHMGTRRREDYLSSITVAEAVQAAAALRAWAVEREAMRWALAYIAKNDIALMVCPRPVPRGYPGHYGQVAKDALSALAPKEPEHG